MLAMLTLSEIEKLDAKNIATKLWKTSLLLLV